MSWLILLAPLALEVACIIHAVRNGRSYIWIFIIFFLPLVGCIAYFAVEILPDMMRSRTAAHLATGARDIADPNRRLRERMREVEMVGSVDAKRGLAEEYITRGAYPEAVELYRSALVGQFREDPALLLGLSRAQFLSGDAAGAQASLDTLQAADPSYVSSDAHLLYARALEAQGKLLEARDEYQKLVRYFPGEEVRCRYGLLLDKLDEHERARELFQEVVKSLQGAPRHYRRAQKEWGDIAADALKR